ncbi:MAG: DUF3276 family protein [Spirochaetaceae bacterium]|jgi:hypothetical protein|nr:DUF3276 family protein [Spirochaetaceae bacterium]
MGIRGEIFSTKVQMQNRTYFFNVKENRHGDLYLNIVESTNRETGSFERQSVILFADDLQPFLKGFDEALKTLEKAQRERKHPARPAGKAAFEKGAPRKKLAFVKDGSAKPGHGRAAPTKDPSGRARPERKKIVVCARKPRKTD